MLYNNYRQALNIISEQSQALTEAMASLGINENILKQWHDEEVVYFQTLGKEPEWDIHDMAYAATGVTRPRVCPRLSPFPTYG